MYVTEGDDEIDAADERLLQAVNQAKKSVG